MIGHKSDNFAQFSTIKATNIKWLDYYNERNNRSNCCNNNNTNNNQQQLLIATAEQMRLSARECQRMEFRKAIKMNTQQQKTLRNKQH